MIGIGTKALAGALVAGLAAGALAQDSFEEKYEKKVSEAWFVDNGFTDDYDAAKAQAAETGKPIFAYFTRSYSP